MCNTLLQHILTDRPGTADIQFLEDLLTRSNLDIADIVSYTRDSERDLSFNGLMYTTLQMIFERFNLALYNCYKVSLPEPTIYANYLASSIESEIDCDFLDLTAENLEKAYKALTLAD